MLGNNTNLFNKPFGLNVKVPTRTLQQVKDTATKAVSKEDTTPTSDKKEEPSAVTDTQKVAPNLSAPKQQTNYTGADLLSKVRSGLSFNTEEKKTHKE